MCRSFVFVVLAYCFVGISDAQAVTQHAHATEPFDGKSLEGWEYEADLWRVEEGSIVGEIPKGERLDHNSWMIWRGETLRDFDLRLQCKLEGAAAANSGIQFRCQADNPRHVSGYQADLDMGAVWLGRIYDEHGRALLVERGSRVKIDAAGKRSAEAYAKPQAFAAIFRENEWNDYRIVAVGSRVSVFVNGTLFAELDDRQTGQADAEGALAFQLHSGPETRVAFRNITIEPLGADDTRLKQLSFREEQEPEQTTSAIGVFPQDSQGNEINFGFEKGDLSGWTPTGKAFQGQPVESDTIASRWRGQESGKQGRFFIGGYEISKSDQAQGTLTSAKFKLQHPFASFLIAGGNQPSTRVDVLTVDASGAEKVIGTAVGDRREQMRRVIVDLSDHVGKEVFVRLVDESSGGWGHLNFDDFRVHKTRPRFPGAEADDPTHHPLLHTLKENKAVADESAASETLRRMHLPEGFSVDTIAAEPDVFQPMAFCFDPKGRLWVVEGHCYPTKRPVGEGIDRILIFADKDGDGSFESRKVFAEGLNLVSGLQVGHGGVWVGAAPDLLFIPDRNRDDVPDSDPVVLLDGFGYADTHETLNSFIWGPDGWLYGNQGVFNRSNVGKPGAVDSNRTEFAAGVWRYHPTKHVFEVFAHGGSNQWGLDFDDRGQCFMTHCRSHFGGGPTTHVLRGGHYWNQTNSNYARFISSRPIAGIASMKNYLLASARYGHGEGGAGKRGSRALYGGHSHVGTMIYLGDNWPSSLRDHLFTHNLHGHRINHQVNVRAGGGYNTVHSGVDVFYCSDPSYIGVDLQYGPDGAVYVSDWYDTRHCHSPHTEQWQRGNGRLYRIQYDGYSPSTVDYWNASTQELVDAHLHTNDWHVRTARLVLAERASTGADLHEVIDQLSKLAIEHDDETRRLRAMWTLHAIGAMGDNLASRLASDSSEYVRGWLVQLLSNDEPSLNANRLITQIARDEKSLFVQTCLASAIPHLPQESAWMVTETLAASPTIEEDRNLPKLLWHSLAQLLESDLERGLRLSEKTPIPSLRHNLLWYAAQVSDRGRQRLVARIDAAKGTKRNQLAQLLADAVANQRGIQPPENWSTIAASLYADATTRAAAETIGASFGDARLMDRMRAVLGNRESTIKQKQHALSVLANDRDQANVAALLPLIDDPNLQVQAIRQLKNYQADEIGSAIVDRLPNFSQPASDAAMETLCSRALWSLQLLDALADDAADESKLTGYYARQMASLGDDDVDARLATQWGEIGQTNAQAKAAIAELVGKYQSAPLWAYNRNAGAAHFKKLCANCHAPTEAANRIGPKLEGSGAKGIEYIVENIIDPNAVIGKDFQARNILTFDGLVVTGVILSENESAMTIRTATATETIAKEEIDRVMVSKNSFMPEELLKQLSDRERIELLMYLMSLK